MDVFCIFLPSNHYRKPLRLRADDAFSSKNSRENSISLSSGKADGNGHFDLKSKPSRKSHYYLYVGGSAWDDVNETAAINASANTPNDLGDILIGKQSFYCKITINGQSGSSITFYPGIYGGQLNSFDPGMATQFLQTVTYSHKDYEGTGHNYLIQYYTELNGIRTFSSMNLPITNSDTLSTNITY